MGVLDIPPLNRAAGDGRYLRGSGTVTTGPVAPSNPANGDIFIDTSKTAITSDQVGPGLVVAAASHASAHAPGGSDALTGYNKSAGGGQETLATNSAAGATPSVNLANGNVHDLTLTANATLSITGAVAGVACSVTLILRQDATGSRTVTWPSSVKWAGATAPTLSTGASKVDIVTLTTVDNGTTWLGFLAGKDMR